MLWYITGREASPTNRDWHALSDWERIDSPHPGPFYTPHDTRAESVLRSMHQEPRSVLCIPRFVSTALASTSDRLIAARYKCDISRIPASNQFGNGHVRATPRCSYRGIKRLMMRSDGLSDRDTGAGSRCAGSEEADNRRHKRLC